MNRLLTALKAARYLGLEQVGLYALYKIGLASGYYRRVTARPPALPSGALQPVLPLPKRDEALSLLGKDGLSLLRAEADEIVGGAIRIFGGTLLPLQFPSPDPPAHWTAYETGQTPFTINHLPIPDIKFLWEPARFGWAFTLGRAFHLTGEDKYAAAFWRAFETFDAANPPYLGPHWMNGQEAALRLMAFVWAGQVFDLAPASTPQRKARLAASIAAHAARIPPTLVYARAQHNNHLLSEAAALLTAGLALPAHPHATRWRALGWKWLNHGLQTQIDSYGEYSQHSTNYHRLMLQVVLWTNALIGKTDLRWPRPTLEAVRRAVHWLLSLLDSDSGRTPNLGANDGAYLFPLSVCPFADFRPVAHAAARVFLNYALPGGAWDEMALWFGAPARGPRTLELPRYIGDQLYGKQSWGYFRTAQFSSRPSHADQLHLDLWWRGENIALDAGTFSYNAPAPWENALVTAFVHNTVTVNGRDQMTRAGRFLYLDWVNAYRKPLPADEPGELMRVQGRYRGRGYRHTRTVSVFEDDRWRVADEILPLSLDGRPFTARLHWLLPDLPWKVENRVQTVEINLDLPQGAVKIGLLAQPLFSPLSSSLSIVRGGEVLFGAGETDPARGWTSPTYGVKIPALSLALTVEAQGAITFITEFTFFADTR